MGLAIGGGVKLSTGVFVLYADPESFTLMTPQGRMLRRDKQGGGEHATKSVT